MLKALTTEKVRFIALLAKAARQERDAFLGNVEDELGGSTPSRGEHNPTAELGFEPGPTDSAQISELREAIADLPSAARSELLALMRIGQGDLAVQSFYRGLNEAASLQDEALTALLVEDPDLHDHLMKSLYEAKLT
jgi:hypothetical protein